MVDSDPARPAGPRAPAVGDAPHRGFSPLEAVVFVVLVGMVTVAALPAFSRPDAPPGAGSFVRTVARAQHPAPADTALPLRAARAPAPR